MVYDAYHLRRGQETSPGPWVRAGNVPSPRVLLLAAQWDAPRPGANLAGGVWVTAEVQDA